MKLIDLLVQELPKRGGWPEGYDLMSTNRHGWVSAYKNNGCVSLFELCICSSEQGIVTRDQYEAALGEPQKAKWDGEGLPPVGCECECHVDEGVIHCIVVGYDFDGKAVVMRNVPARKYFSIQANSGRIKPLRTEVERKRDAAVEAIDYWLPEYIPDTPNEFYHAKKIYDSIAAGKIPGVKLEG